jgi:hypothetical protein
MIYQTTVVRTRGGERGEGERTNEKSRESRSEMNKDKKRTNQHWRRKRK